MKEFFYTYERETPKLRWLSFCFGMASAGLDMLLVFASAQEHEDMAGLLRMAVEMRADLAASGFEPCGGGVCGMEPPAAAEARALVAQFAGEADPLTAALASLERVH